jgi:Spy/CpxP family protein refolding chaperone
VIPAIVAAALALTVIALTIAAARATDGHRDPDDLQPPPGGAR